MDINSTDAKFENTVDEELKYFAPSLKSFGFASTKKQTVVNSLVFTFVLFSFTLAVFYKGFLRALSLEFGLFLLSLKLAYFMHNIIKFNHYQFWILNALEMHMLNIKKDVDNLTKLVEQDNQIPK
ncbi:hypothetical protein J7L67_04895 [bacterium]|nr:hypothetical protein [bacterium]